MKRGCFVFCFFFLIVGGVFGQKSQEPLTPEQQEEEAIRAFENLPVSNQRKEDVIEIVKTGAAENTSDKVQINKPTNSTVDNSLNHVLKPTEGSLGSKAVNRLSAAFMLLAAIFILIAGIEIIKDVMINGKPISYMEIIKLTSIVALVVTYDAWMYNFVDVFFGAFIGYIEEMSSNANPIHEILTSHLGDEPSFLRNTGKFILFGICNFLLKGTEFIDFIFKMYAHICLFFVRLFGIVAITFALLPAFRKVLTTWISAYFKYQLYFVVIAFGYVLSTQFVTFWLHGLLSVKEPLAVGMAAASAPVLANILGQIVFLFILLLVFKIMFCVIGMKVIDSLFPDGNVGVGAVCGGVAGAVSSGAMMMATGGASKAAQAAAGAAAKGS